MKKIVLFLMLAVMGCGDTSYQVKDEKQSNPWDSKIHSWQTREMSEQGFPEPDNSGIVDMERAKEISSWFIGDYYSPAHVSQIDEPVGENYWQTSRETEHRGAGDCEDLSILFYMKMREAGFPDDKIGLAINPTLNPFEFHVVAFFWSGGRLFEANNGVIRLFSGAPARTFNLFKAESAL